eukprot:2443116-Rhodomonas_salina.4
MDARMLDEGYSLESDREQVQKTSKQIATEAINTILAGGEGQESIGIEAVQAAVMELQTRYAKEIQRIKNSNQGSAGNAFHLSLMSGTERGKGLALAGRARPDESPHEAPRHVQQPFADCIAMLHTSSHTLFQLHHAASHFDSSKSNA